MTEDLAPEVMAELAAIKRRLDAGEALAMWRCLPFSMRAEVVPFRDEDLDGFVYVEVDESVVDLDVAAAAFRSLRYCVADLGLDPAPRLRWMVPEDDDERAFAKQHTRDWEYRVASQPVNGLFDGDVWLLATLTPTQAIATAAHECRHNHQAQRGSLSLTRPARVIDECSPERDPFELEANRYAARVMREVL